MGMFDYFDPDPELPCPACATPLTEWQSKDGLDALFVWRQGNPAPVEQRVDEEVRLLPEQLAQQRLPDGPLEFYTSCSNCEQRIDAWGVVQDGVWTSAIVETADNIVVKRKAALRISNSKLQQTLLEPLNAKAFDSRTVETPLRDLEGLGPMRADGAGLSRDC